MTISVGKHIPALILLFELDAQPVAYIAGPTQADTNELVHRLGLEHGPEWLEALMHVMKENLEPEDDEA
jgi:hypothetical protein